MCTFRRTGSCVSSTFVRPSKRAATDWWRPTLTNETSRWSCERISPIFAHHIYVDAAQSGHTRTPRATGWQQSRQRGRGRRTARPQSVHFEAPRARGAWHPRHSLGARAKQVPLRAGDVILHAQASRQQPTRRWSSHCPSSVAVAQSKLSHETGCQHTVRLRMPVNSHAYTASCPVSSKAGARFAPRREL